MQNKMNLQSRKIEFIEEFLKIQDEDLLSQFENLLKNKNNKEIDENEFFKPISIQEFSNRIEKAEDDFKNGNYKATSQLLEKYK
jgi:hypothetical protein